VSEEPSDWGVLRRTSFRALGTTGVLLGVGTIIRPEMGERARRCDEVESLATNGSAADRPSPTGSKTSNLNNACGAETKGGAA
jgi:hypothetical protein